MEFASCNVAIVNVHRCERVLTMMQLVGWPTHSCAVSLQQQLLHLVDTLHGI